MQATVRSGWLSLPFYNEPRIQLGLVDQDQCLIAGHSLWERTMSTKRNVWFNLLTLLGWPEMGVLGQAAALTVRSSCEFLVHSGCGKGRPELAPVHSDREIETDMPPRLLLADCVEKLDY